MSLSARSKIVHFGPLSSGHIQKWTKGLVDDYDICYLTFHDGDVDGEKILLPTIIRSKLNYILCIPLILYYLIKLNPKIVHAHYYSSYGVILSLMPFVKNKFLSVWGSDINNLNFDNFFFKWFYRFSLSRFKYINSAAQHLSKKIESLNINPVVIIETYQYGITMIPDKLNFQKDKPSNYTVSFFSPRNFDKLYRIDSVISVFKKLLVAKNMNAVLHIYGRGNESETKYIKGLCDHPNVKFMGFVSQEEIVEAAIKNDIVVSFPDRDGTPLSLLEAVAYGCYPVLSDIQANHNCFSTKNALFASDSNELEIAIYQSYQLVLHNAEDLYCSLSNNWRYVKKEGSYEVNIAKLITAYERFICHE
ncbi:glycosyltransferase [Shewanella sp. 10N.286.52.B9]|uniref:glycosyltransferase n=1 Tax=Shewanella sp. 10N.286.52.B9 TaxID=1880837 RepID=UPI000C823A33|nr:glycosyltransferase [Shewanella sp. 10N.286.52.B9]PMG49638.1 hypothetical protein BCU91_18245 [Shewanella sp. 10N.286.52.B9]